MFSQVQQLTVCVFGSWGKKKLLDRTGWLSIRQLIFFHTLLPTYKINSTKVPKSIYKSLNTGYNYNTRRAANGMIRQEEMPQSSFRYRAMKSLNQVPVSVRTGSPATVKRKLKLWVKSNIPIN